MESRSPNEKNKKKCQSAKNPEAPATMQCGLYLNRRNESRLNLKGKQALGLRLGVRSRVKNRQVMALRNFYDRCFRTALIIEIRRELLPQQTGVGSNNAVFT